MLDTSFLLAVRLERQAQGEAALIVLERLREGAWGPALLPEYVLLEMVTVLQRRVGHKVATAAAVELLETRELEFVPSSEVFPDALEIFLGQQGTALSLADASVVAVARARKARYVATFDQEFRKVKGLKVVPA